MAVPGVFSPALIDGHYYVDGGVIEELPVDVLRARGADVVITSDLGIKRNFFDPEHPSPIDILRRSSDMAIESESKSLHNPAGIDRQDSSFSEKTHIQIHCLLNISHYRAIINLEKYTF
jgi:predicted acylesterase/phospholipase RssA